MQERGNEKELLGQGEQHLDQVRRPAVDEPVEATRSSRLAYFGDNPVTSLAWHSNPRIDQAASFLANQGAGSRPDLL
jgi:hypothetical protein